MFGPERNEIIRDWRKLSSKVLHNFYSLPNVITVMKSRIVKWKGHVACMGGKMNIYI
jgi:hypothetical protein